MRKDDHSMMVVTGLVVAVGIGIVSERMSSGFGGPETEVGQPVNDRFMVRAGVATDLDVRSNDGRLTGDIVIAQGPSCGVAHALGDLIRFDSSETCSGPVSFSYCVGDDADCAPAVVHLSVEAAAMPAPETPVPAENVADKLDLEPMSPQEVVKSGPEFALIPTDRIEDAGLRVFVATLARPAEMRPVSVVAQYTSDASASDLSTAPENASEPTDLHLSVEAPRAARAAEFLRSYAETAPVDGPPQVSVLERLGLAALQDEARFDATLPAQRTMLVEDAEVADEPVTEQIEQVAARFDSDVPASGTCEVSSDLAPAPGAHVTLSLTAPCLAGKTVIARSRGLDFLLAVSEEGTLVADLPALEVDAKLTLDLGSDRAPLTLMADGSGVLQVERSVFRLKSDLGLEISAFETSAAGEVQEISLETALAHRDAFLQGSGYMRRYSSTKGRVIDVYTLPLSRQVVARSVKMAVKRSGPGLCAGAVMMEYMQVGADTPTLSQAQLPATACLSKSGFSLQAIVRPIQVASQ